MRESIAAKIKGLAKASAVNIDDCSQSTPYEYFWSEIKTLKGL